MSESYQAQPWQYHYNAPKAGRKLWLMKPDELPLLIPLVLRVGQLHLQESKSHLFTSAITRNYKVSSDKFLQLSNRLQELKLRIKSGKVYDPQLKAVNEEINQYFSDDGWRFIRKEYQQILKRNKKSHIEIPNDILKRLKEYQQRNGFSDYGQTIDELLIIATTEEVL